MDCVGKFTHPHIQAVLTAVSDIFGFLLLSGFTFHEFCYDAPQPSHCFHNAFFRLYVVGLFCSLLLLIGALFRVMTLYFIYIGFKLVFIVLFPYEMYHAGAFEEGQQSSWNLTIAYGALVIFFVFNIASIVSVMYGIKYLSAKKKEKQKKISGSNSIKTRIALDSVE